MNFYSINKINIERCTPTVPTVVYKLKLSIQLEALGVVSGGRGVGGLVVGGGGGVRLGLGVDSGSLVGHVSDISVISVGGVLDVLDSDVIN